MEENLNHDQTTSTSDMQQKEIPGLEESDLQSRTMLELMGICDISLNNNGLTAESIAKIQPALTLLANRLDITTDEAMWLSALFNQGEFTNINYCKLCNYFNCRPIQALQYKSIFDTLIQKELLHHSRNSKTEYDIPNYVIDAIGKNEVPCPTQYNNLTVTQWLDALEELFDACEEDEITYDILERRLSSLFSENMRLSIVKKIMSYALCPVDCIILLITLNKFVAYNDECISQSDIRSVIDMDNRRMRFTVSRATRNDGDLFKAGILEYNNSDGFLDSTSWRLSDKTKIDLLGDTEYGQIETTKKKPTDLLESINIKPKQLFYNPQVTQQIQDLSSILSKEHFQKVQERLTEKGLRKGFASIFYGAPGTGKTETVLQIGRQTGRDIMQVDMSKLRNAFVGESEKNVKNVFDRYRRLCKDSELAPILLFNEADAILGKRNSDAMKAVDKMENAIQNIILQEMENLDGIMIATTNLTSNLDEAFERRFLYKIEFPEPTPDESQHIWKSMLPDLNDESALLLAKQYQFSGGQIENIARKQTVYSILYGDEYCNIDRLQEYCKEEKLKKRNAARAIMGFQ